MHGILNRTTNRPASDLGKLVAKLPDLLAPPSTPYPRTAREAVRQADKGVSEAVESLNAVARRHQGAVRPFHPLPDIILNAQKAVDAARSAQQRAQKALDAEKARREERFLKEVYPVHVMTRKSFGLMMRKLSVTESQRSAAIPRNLFTQKTERRIGELGTSCVALVVSDVSVHEAP